MIISLKDNKRLLIRRKTFFDRKHSHEELKRIHSQRLDLNEKQLTEDEKRRIRQTIRADFKREIIINLLVVTVCLLMISTIGYVSMSQSKSNSEIPKYHLSQVDELETYNECISNGISNLNRNQPFFAIGHFKNALEIKPNDQIAIEKLIQSYLMLCYQNEETCEMVQAKIDSLGFEAR